ncbi:hypothetical protein [Clostridium ganghwense]|uniref:Glycoside hydrolase family 65 N-terminal domain-containing protein n=1 Tax=Clostridium ganghwense TaxID=312089 RepID=A0ABT4CKL7_9CLOT|nr:hypothetical protein [Clostridium ganghwense]MCY6369593.1 hypothetical protein [Clostridium ganghwense]
MVKKKLGTNNIILDKWRIIEKEFNLKDKLLDETIFYVGNGYIGMKGSFEEGDYDKAINSLNGTYINGFYELKPILNEEEACAYERNNETMLNVTNAKIIRLYIEDEELNMLNGILMEYNRILDFKEGILHRHLIWQSPKGKRVEVNIKRMISFSNKHLAAISYEVIPLNFSGKVRIVSALEGQGMQRADSALEEKNLKVLKSQIRESFGAITSQTTNTKFVLVCGMENQLLGKSDFKMETREDKGKVEVIYTIDGKVNKRIELNKYITYFTSKEYSKEKLYIKTENALQKAKRDGFEKIEELQKEFLQEFWNKNDIKVKEEELLNQAIRFNEFSLLQSNGKAYAALMK